MGHFTPSINVDKGNSTDNSYSITPFDSVLNRIFSPGSETPVWGLGGLFTKLDTSHDSQRHPLTSREESVLVSRAKSPDFPIRFSLVGPDTSPVPTDLRHDYSQGTASSPQPLDRVRTVEGVGVVEFPIGSPRATPSVVGRGSRQKTGGRW